VFSSNAVLQRDVPLPVWGWAKPGTKVTVWIGADVAAVTTGPDGAWRAVLPSQQVATDVRMVVEGRGTTLTFTNVAIGDVWLCSGQSNMECPLWWCTPSSIIRYADHPLIRTFRTRRVIAAKPQDDFSERTRAWAVCTPSVASNMTAIGFYFARDIQSAMGIPIGIINTSWGGANIESYLSQEGVVGVGELRDIIQQETDYVARRSLFPRHIGSFAEWLRIFLQELGKGEGIALRCVTAPVTTMRQLLTTTQTIAGQRLHARFNGMVAPCTDYPIRGILWYQGEANVEDGRAAYRAKMEALATGWRNLWGVPDLPFYWVQLANLGEDTLQPAGGDGCTEVRTAQFEAMSSLLPNAGMVVSFDVGDGSPHPWNKYDTGRRLANWVLHDVYGCTDVIPSGPLYRGMSVEDNRIVLSFDYVGKGLMVGMKKGVDPVVEEKNRQLARFAIAGEDRHWFWAEAVIEGDTVVVSHPSVPHPVAVRYAFSANPQGANLYNKDGLPASPFRTDRW